MLPLSLGLVVVFISWIAADLLSILTNNLFIRTDFDLRLSSFLTFQVTREQLQKVARLLYFVALVFGVGFSLAAVIGVEPFRNPLTTRMQTFWDYELTREVLVQLPDYLILFVGLFIAAQLIRLINGIFPRAYAQIEEWRRTHFQVIKFQNLELITPYQLAGVLTRLTKYLRWAVNIFIAAIGLTILFSFFPGTQVIVEAVLEILLDVLTKTWDALMAFLPSLFTLVIITVVTIYALRLLRFFYNGFRDGKIKFAGFHPELLEPTYYLMRFLILALALVAAFPYIPGSDSPVFRGITIFAGFLLSLGSTSLVTNVISGLVLTYSRGLKIGDRVKIGETVGDVVERSILVTRVRTIKNVEVTIPNGMVLGSHIVNYSANAQERGVILHTTITIGYDEPWRQVHELMKAAAVDTEHIMEFPEPFVLQTSLDDYYVSYELNAYTMRPARMADIYSDLHRNIQDRFNEAGVEIMSPAYTNLRDGGHTTVPREYLPVNYRPPKLFSTNGHSSNERPTVPVTRPST